MFRPRGARSRKTRNTEATPNDGVKLEHGHFSTSDGTRLFYCIEGEGNGPPLVFCYGLVCSALHWTYQLDYFRKNYRCIWFDYRGHHQSDAPADFSTMRVETFAQDLLELLEFLKVREAVFLGHSMGVNVVLEACRRKPELFKALVLIGGTARAPLETLFNMNLTRTVLKGMKTAYSVSPNWVKKLWNWQKDSFLTEMLVTFGGFNPFLTPKEDIQLYIKQVLSFDPGVFIRILEDYDRFDAQSWLHSIRSPALVIAGEQDHIVPLRQQEILAQLLPEGRLESIRYGSHCPQMDLPEIVNSHIETFLREFIPPNQG